MKMHTTYEHYLAQLMFERNYNPNKFPLTQNQLHLLSPLTSLPLSPHILVSQSSP